jgi:hypothetical protein
MDTYDPEHRDPATDQPVADWVRVMGRAVAAALLVIAIVAGVLWLL